jgi:hypothetical protein
MLYIISSCQKKKLRNATGWRQVSTLPCKYSYTNRPCRRRALCGGRLELYQQSREENKHTPAGQRARAGPAVNTRICLGRRPTTSTRARAGHVWARKGMNTGYSYSIQPVTCGWMVQISNLHILLWSVIPSFFDYIDPDLTSRTQVCSVLSAMPYAPMQSSYHESRVQALVWKRGHVTCKSWSSDWTRGRSRSDELW